MTSVRTEKRAQLANLLRLGRNLKENLKLILSGEIALGAVVTIPQDVELREYVIIWSFTMLRYSDVTN